MECRIPSPFDLVTKWGKVAKKVPMNVMINDMPKAHINSISVFDEYHIKKDKKEMVEPTLII
ncbi:MAG: hypothetical protein Salg2KO_07190 [Salibacteraceae bacterium]